jgi:Zn-dependent protease
MRSKVVQKPKSYEYSVTYPTIRPGALTAWPFYFSKKEIGHLTIAVFLVVGVGLSFEGFNSSFSMDHLTIILFIVMFTVSFLMHEIAHKVVAQKYGLWAEFRLTLIGAALTLLSVMSPFFKVIAPGAVMVAGSTDRRIAGRTSIAGPITNIILAMALLVALFILPDYFRMLAPITAFNAWITLINLIPFGILDGFKVFTWNKKVWSFAFASSATLTAISALLFLNVI